MRLFFLIAVICSCTLFECEAQSMIATWAKKYEAYQSTWPRTKLHLILNQNKFSPGDTLWFKAYFLNDDLTPVKGKQLIDLNLIDSGGESKLHFVFTMMDGLGQNQVAIPGSLSAGIYQLNAYSSWMKNFDPKFIFNKEILIVKDNGIRPVGKPAIGFAIEGKHLVRDVSNKITVSGQAGTTIRVVDTNNEEVGSADTNVNGLASVVFTPHLNMSYFIKSAGPDDQVALPAVEADGCALRITPSTGVNEPVKMIAASPSGSAFLNEELTVIVTSRGKIYHTDTFIQGVKDVFELQIPYAKLTDGVSQVAILSKNGSLLASREFYNSLPGLQSTLQLTKTSFQTREKVRLEINLMDNKGQPIEGEFAISVVNQGLFNEQKQNSFNDELNLIHNSTNKFVVDRSLPDWWKNVDNFLILSSDEVPWREILKNESKPYYRFTNVVQKRGSVYYADTSLTVPDLTQLTFYLQRNQSVYHTFVEKGKVWLTMPDVFGQDEIFYLAESKRKQIPNVRIVWDEDPIPATPVTAFTETQIPDPYAEFSRKRRLMDHSYGFYSQIKESEPINIKKSSAEFEDEIMGADITINIQDYILFPTMDELIKEVIPPLYHRKFGDREIVRVKLPEPQNSNITGDAVFVIDGIATNNTAFFLSLKPADILTVKIVRDPIKLSRFGLMGKNGIVIVQTKNGDARELIDASRIIEGINKSLDFINNNYNNVNDLHRPNFRSTLYWNPSVKIDSKGKAVVEFFCSDDIGKFQIRVDGMTTSAKPFTAQQTIEVGIGEQKD